MDIASKTFAFSIRIVKANQYLTREQKEFILSKQMLRSGTSIGAMVRESKFAQSDADFINKLSIALKGANETLYWLELLHETGYITEDSFHSIHKDASEVTAMLVSIVKTSKNKLHKDS